MNYSMQLDKNRTIRVIRMRKEKVKLLKLSVLEDDVIMYLENLKE